MKDARGRELSIIRRVGLLLVAALLSGCAATNIQRAEQLGALGKAYADAVTAAGDEAIASTVTFSLEEIKKERKGGAFKTPDERDHAIVDEIEVLKKRQGLVVESDAQVALLGEYFASLEQFAKQDVGGAVETATGGLTESINKLGSAIQSNPEAKATLSEAERTAIAKLSGAVARQMHGQALCRILERDAAMIGTQLKLLSKVLATYAGWVAENLVDQQKQQLPAVSASNAKLAQDVQTTATVIGVVNLVSASLGILASVITLFA